MKYTVRSAVMPLLLGFGKTSVKTSWRLTVKYGIVPTVLDKNKSLVSFFTLFSSFRKLPDTNSDDILLMSLERVADEYGDMTCVIIPCEESYKKFVSKNRQLLESRFILRTPDTACQLSPRNNKKD